VPFYQYILLESAAIGSVVVRSVVTYPT